MKAPKKIYVLSYPESESRSQEALEVDVFKRRKDADDHVVLMRNEGNKVVVSCYVLASEPKKFKPSDVHIRKLDSEAPRCKVKSWQPWNLALTYASAQGHEGALCAVCAKSWNDENVDRIMKGNAPKKSNKTRRPT